MFKVSITYKDKSKGVVGEIAYLAIRYPKFKSGMVMFFTSDSMLVCVNLDVIDMLIVEEGIKESTNE